MSPETLAKIKAREAEVLTARRSSELRMRRRVLLTVDERNALVAEVERLREENGLLFRSLEMVCSDPPLLPPRT